MNALVLDRLKSQLLTSGLSQKDSALFQVINGLIDAAKEGVEANNIISGGGGGGGGFGGQSFLTYNLEQSNGLPSSRQVIAGPGISINKTGTQFIISATPEQLSKMLSEGDRGPRGFVGDRGLQGPIGSLGPRGFVGEDGLIGPHGPIGSQGIQGVSGFVGPRGLSGSDGELGRTGLMGPMGPSGYEILDAKLGADFVVTNAGLTNVTDLKWTTSTNRAYVVDFYGIVQANNTTGDIVLDLVAASADWTAAECFGYGVHWSAAAALTNRLPTVFTSTTSAQGALVVNNGDGVGRPVQFRWMFFATGIVSVNLQIGVGTPAVGRTATLQSGARLRVTQIH